MAKCHFDQLLLKADNLGNLSTDDASLLANSIRDNALEQWGSRELAQLCSAVTRLACWDTPVGDLSEKACVTIVANRAALVGVGTLPEEVRREWRLWWRMPLGNVTAQMRG
eukprot:4535666-Pyramimonas_sp.AAC.1